MFDRILVPVDGTARGAEATEIARHLAGRFAARMTLLRVEGALTSLEHVLADNRELERRASDLRQHGMHVVHSVEFGRPDKAITELAESERAQLIVMAPHHRAYLESLWHPSVTQRVLGRAPAPILVWPQQEPPRAYTQFLQIAGSHVLVPLDGSALAEQALPYAVAFAEEYARPLLLIRVVPPPLLVSGRLDAYRAERDYHAREECEAHAYLAATRRRLCQEHAGLHVQSMLLSGEPWRELVRCAQTRDGGLMVMATHGRSGLGRALFGSVAAQLVRAAPLPLLIVPPPQHLESLATAPARATSTGLENSHHV